MAVLFSDNFNRSNSGTLGANWTALAASFSIVSNQAVCDSSATSTYYSATNGPADGYIQTTVVTFPSPSSYLGLVYRLNTSTFNGYYLGMDTTGTSLYRIDGGTPTRLGSAYSSPSNGDVIRIEFNGGTHEVFYNGSSQGTRSDSTYTGANRCGLSGQGTAGVIDNFEVGDLTTTVTLEQEGYRFYNDDGNEAGATALAAQDTGASIALDTNVILRALVNATGDPASSAFQLEYKKSSDSTYVPVLTAAPSAPAWQANGTVASGTADVTVNWPTHQAGDIGLLLIESTGGQTANLGTAAGFAAVTDSPSATGTTTLGTRVTAYWCRATSSSMSSPVITDPGDHAVGIIITFRGCIAEGNPWDVTAAAVKASASTSASAPAVTTTQDNCLIVNVISRDNDSASAAFSAQANASLSSVAERYDAGSTQGNGGGLGVITGVKASAGAVSATTATVTSSINASLTIALRPQTTPVIMSPSSNIAASAATATTARLTAPSGKTTSDFTAGKISDDTNPVTVDIGSGKYTELAWSIKSTAPAVDADVYNFLVTVAGTVLDTYSVTPALTTTSSGSTVNGVGSAAMVVAASAVGKVIKPAVGAASFAFDQSAVGTAAVKATGAASFAFDGAAVGVAASQAVGAASFAFDAAATATASSIGAGSASFAFGASATGEGYSIGAGSAAFAFDAAAVGLAATKGVGASSVTFAATAAGKDYSIGAGAASYVFDGSGVSRSTAKAVGAASFDFTVVGLADSPMGTAAGASAISFDAAAAGAILARAVGTASLTFDATGSGRKTSRAAGASAITFGAAGTARSTARAAGAAAVVFDAQAVGNSVAAGAAVGDAAFVFDASGVGSSVARAVGSASFSFGANGISPAAAEITGGAGRRITPQEWLRLNRDLNREAVERSERLRPVNPARVRRSKERILRQAATIQAVDTTAAEQLRELWRRWFEAELRVSPVSVDDSYQRFVSELAVSLADERMESEIEEMLILMAVAVLL